MVLNILSPQTGHPCASVPEFHAPLAEVLRALMAKSRALHYQHAEEALEDWDHAVAGFALHYAEDRLPEILPDEERRAHDPKPAPPRLPIQPQAGSTMVFRKFW